MVIFHSYVSLPEVATFKGLKNGDSPQKVSGLSRTTFSLFLAAWLGEILKNHRSTASPSCHFFELCPRQGGDILRNWCCDVSEKSLSASSVFFYYSLSNFCRFSFFGCPSSCIPSFFFFSYSPLFFSSSFLLPTVCTNQRNTCPMGATLLFDVNHRVAMTISITLVVASHHILKNY